jgi:hypothetical protein
MTSMNDAWSNANGGCEPEFGYGFGYMRPLRNTANMVAIVAAVETWRNTKAAFAQIIDLIWRHGIGSFNMRYGSSGLVYAGGLRSLMKTFFQ